MIEKVIAVYSGRFQPFGKHHAAAFMWLQKQFGKDNCYILTSNHVELPKSPFTFSEKKAIIDVYGFASHVIEVKNPYRPEELLKKFDASTTAIVFMVGEKDMQEDPRFRLKRAGYFQMYKSNNIKKMSGYLEHGYLIIAPHIKLSVPGYGEMSGTSIRKALGSKSKSRKDKINLFKQIFGWYSEKLANIIFDKLESLNEDLIPGGKASGKTLEDIAYHHFDSKGYYHPEDAKDDERYRGILRLLKMNLRKGIEVELEHTNNEDIAKEIAMDHLWEDYEYYTKLQTIHKEERALTKDWWSDILNENLVDHSKYELQLAGLFDKDADYGGMIGKAVLELMKVFSKQGHSGFSAAWVRDLFNKLSNFENLTPISSNKDEWTNVSEFGNDGNGLWQNKRNPAMFSKDGGKSWYNVDDKYIKEALNIVLSKKDIIKEGGSAGHMQNVFEVESVKTGKDIISVFEKSIEYLNKGTGALKIDGINASVRLVNVNGKREFVMDRGSNKPLDVKGITKSDLVNRFGVGHGMIEIGGKVLDIFNESIPKIKSQLEYLGLWDNPNILFNVEYVAGQTNVLTYDKNFIAIHGLLEIKQVTPTKRVTHETPYNYTDLETLINNMKPIAAKNKFEVFGSIPTTFDKKPNLSIPLNKVYTIRLTKTKSVKHTLKQLLDRLVIPKGININWGDKQVAAISKVVFVDILDGSIVKDNTKHTKLAIDGFTTYLATMELGDEVLKSMTSPLGTVDTQEGVVIRDINISDKPVKITGKFLVKGLESKFK